MEQVIFHVDANSAFLSWEAAYRIHHLGGRQDLRDIPSVISGNKEARHGIILAKSIPAKKYGIQTGMAVTEAVRKCPNLTCVPPNYTLYQKCSAAFIGILEHYTPTVEKYSIDEAFMDMTSCWQLYGDSPLDVAVKIKDQIRDTLGFTVNIGISSNKLLAKMAGEFRKPDHANTLFMDELEEKLWILPVSELFFVGRATTAKLFNLGIRTIGELAMTNPVLLRKHFGKHGDVIWGFANGIDCSVVEAHEEEQKGYGNSTTIAFDVTRREDARLILLALSETVGTRLRKDRVKAEVISVGIKSFDLSYASHQKIMPCATDITREIYKYSCELFDELWDGQTPIRHLGIRTGRISKDTAARQLTLFDSVDYEKFSVWDHSVDRIRERFGTDTLKRAAFIKSPIDHLSGGISREKRSVDYSKQEIK